MMLPMTSRLISTKAEVRYNEIDRLFESTIKVKGEQVHAHLDKGSAINIDGTLKHGNGNEITVGIAKWLKKNGWKL